MSDLLHLLDAVTSLILSIWGLVEFTRGMLRKDYAQATFGVALALLGKP